MAIQGINGITFDYQEVTSKADGALYRAALQNQDCRLLGAVATKQTDNQIRITSGYISMNGRVIQFDGNYIHTISSFGTSNGYGRLVGRIDLTQTATTETFDQFSIIEQFSNTLTGFDPLFQEDQLEGYSINGGGTIWDAVLCTFSVVSSKIDSIISFMPPYNKVISDITARVSSNESNITTLTSAKDGLNNITNRVAYTDGGVAYPANLKSVDRRFAEYTTANITPITTALTNKSATITGTLGGLSGTLNIYRYGNVCQISGSIGASSQYFQGIAAGDIIGTLPEGYRPSAQITVPLMIFRTAAAWTNADFGYAPLVIGSGGNILFQGKPASYNGIHRYVTIMGTWIGGN